MVDEKKPDSLEPWRNQGYIPYNARQFSEPYRSTVHAGRFVQSLKLAPAGDALDVACGAGANIFYLSQLLKGYRWSGVDISGDFLFPIGRPYFAERQPEVNLIEGDFFRLTELFSGRQFDLVFSFQTLSWLPDYAPALDQLMAVTRGWLIVTSLFTDFDVEVRTQVTDYSQATGSPGPFPYNIYNLARFQAYCEAKGCTRFVSQDFDIDIDLAPPQANGIGTYTRTCVDGKRLQFSGPLALPWKFIGIQMS